MRCARLSIVLSLDRSGLRLFRRFDLRSLRARRSAAVALCRMARRLSLSLFSRLTRRFGIAHLPLFNRLARLLGINSCKAVILLPLSYGLALRLYRYALRLFRLARRHCGFIAGLRFPPWPYLLPALKHRMLFMCRTCVSWFRHLCVRSTFLAARARAALNRRVRSRAAQFRRHFVM